MVSSNEFNISHRRCNVKSYNKNIYIKGHFSLGISDIQCKMPRLTPLSSRFEYPVDIGKWYVVGLGSGSDCNALLMLIDLQHNAGDGLVSFDECFTTKIGGAPHEIKATSICGQYLTKHPDVDIQKLLSDAGLKPDEEKSKFNDLTKYKSGSIVPFGDDLLLAFAKLNENGRGYFPTREAYLNSLAVMWSEIHKYYQQKDVCIPVLGGGLTNIGETMLTHQELVDLIIESYKLFTYKIPNPQRLRIICSRKDDISLNKIGESI